VTDWSEIALLYSRLLDFTPSPVVELNRAVAVALAHGPEHGLALADAIDGLDEYYLLHSTRADLLRRLGRRDEGGDAYERALGLAPTEVERAFLRGRMVEEEGGRT
jgi:RNA polymerase sigma-70 factor (ECF subfamily)